MPKSGVAPLQRDTFGFTAAGGKLYAHGGEIGPSEYERSVCVLYTRAQGKSSTSKLREVAISSPARVITAQIIPRRVPVGFSLLYRDAFRVVAWMTLVCPDGARSCIRACTHRRGAEGGERRFHAALPKP